jgi:AP2-associated kinase
MNHVNLFPVDIGSKVHGSKSSVVPSRAPPAPPLQKNIERGSPTPALNYGTHQSSSKETDNVSTSTVSKGGSFWSSQYASEAQYEDTNSPSRSKSSNTENQFSYKSKSPPLQTNTSPFKEPHSVSPFKEPRSVSPFKEPHSVRTDTSKRRGDSSVKMYSGSGMGDADPGYTRFEADNDSKRKDPSSNISQLVLSGDSKSDQAFIEFVADFQKMSTVSSENKGIELEDKQVEIEKLRNELKEMQREKLEIASKYEKLTAICRSQRIEIQDLKSSLAAANNQNSSMEPSISHASSQVCVHFLLHLFLCFATDVLVGHHFMNAILLILCLFMRTILELPWCS